ncbi:MAG: hypothetical protein QOF28_2950 [Actinomycetota bacterium]|jgi:hypothetical protein|nr:hypothetical protein [Actinomycetota bacterium]
MANAATQPSADITAALATAERLVADGHPFDAIRILTQANRVDPNTRLEERLVSLRHEAFEVLGPRSPVSMSPVVSDGGPSCPLPEMSPEELTVTTLRAGFARHGCVLVRNLLPTARAEELADDIDRALGAFDAGAEGAPPTETSPWYLPFTPRAGKYRVGGRRNWMRASGGMWTVDSPRMLFAVLDLVETTGIGRLLTEYLGERPALSANKCNLRRVPVTSDTNWHQDGAFLGADVRSVNLWLGLSHCGVDAPGLDIVPQRLDEVLETGTDGAIFDWSVSPEVVERVGTPVLRPELGPGDALLFDHFFLHRTGVAPGMTRERHAIETWFFAPSTYPDGQIPLVY